MLSPCEAVAVVHRRGTLFSYGKGCYSNLTLPSFYLNFKAMREIEEVAQRRVGLPPGLDTEITGIEF